jgi:hypothetical protein
MNLRLLSVPLQLLVILGVYLVLALGVAWSVAALWYFDPLPSWASRAFAVLFGAFAVAIMAGIPIAGMRRYYDRLPLGLIVLSIAVGVAAVTVLWDLKRPSAGIEWKEGMKRSPIVRYEDDGTVWIDNFRNTRYRAADQFDVRWETRTYPLGGIVSLDIITEPFREWEGASHVMLSFGFDNGEHVVVSVEARIPEGDRFNLVRGAFKEYGLIYIVGDERDLLFSRLYHREHPLYIYPISVQYPEQLRALFVLTMNHAASIERRPQFYDSLTNNCTNTVLRHIEYLTATDFPWLDYRIHIPGFLGELLYDSGVLASDLSWDELRARARIDKASFVEELDRPIQEVPGPVWSERLRRAWRSETAQTSPAG